MSEAEPTIETFFRKWIRKDRIQWAILEVQLALYEFRELESAGTDAQRVKAANNVLIEIEEHADALSKAINAMPNRARWAIFEHQPTDLHRLDELSAGLLPLVNIAKRARDTLPHAARGPGQPRKFAESPRDALIRRIASIHRDAATGRPGATRAAAVEHAFVHALLSYQGIDLPDDLGRIIGTNTAKYSKK